MIRDYSDILEPREEGWSTVEIFAAIRNYRNAELSATDYTQLPDAPVDKAAWAAYRQELRDLPSQNEDPKLIVFPERP